MYEDIFELVTIATRKRNLKESTANAYCHAPSPFLNATGKPWQELTIADVDDYLTAKRLAGIMPETYNHYYGALRLCTSGCSSSTGTKMKLFPAKIIPSISATPKTEWTVIPFLLTVHLTF